MTGNDIDDEEKIEKRYVSGQFPALNDAWEERALKNAGLLHTKLLKSVQRTSFPQRTVRPRRLSCSHLVANFSLH